ncbi:MAG TPA: anthranilate synthase component I family protein, partial [Flavisolibacter sp.]
SGLQDLDIFLENQDGWIFGHLSYELKEPLHGIPSRHRERVGFPSFFFFVPRVVCTFRENELTIFADDPDSVYAAIQSRNIPDLTLPAAPMLQPRLTKDEYLEKINRLRQHIHRGDCYEINFCQEFYAEDASIDPVSTYLQLTGVSPNPFSACYRVHDSWLMCASPERFLFREGKRILSQPIKGTMQRDVADPRADEGLRRKLSESEKERAENVMIVDLVRNDLSRVCTDASVQVDELFGIYTFPQVHQMISTISGSLRDDARFSDVLRATFPMGSMTGAPKHRVMQLIDTYETAARGIFSGSVGYFMPGRDFDFNVVIRSMMYNSATRYLSYQVGSGITFYSNAEAEWEECMLKAAAIKKVLAGPALPKM